jgi:hypothetical protein
MATIAEYQSLGNASVRGLASGTAVDGLPREDREAFNQTEDVDGDQAAPVVPLGNQDQADAGLAQVGGTEDANPVGATTGTGGDAGTQDVVRNELASTDQQLPTPFDPSRGTQLDIAV